MGRAARLKGRLELAAFKAGGALAPRLPESVANRSASAIRRILQRALVGRRLMLERHMRRALGPGVTNREVDAAVRGAFDSYARYWVETFRLGGFPPERIREIFDVDPPAHFYDTYAQGKGMILALPHVGNWEVAGAWVADQGIRIVAVAEDLDPPELAEWFVELRREHFGIEIVPLNDPEVGTKLGMELLAGNVVALLADRDINGRGPEVEFFGETTTLPVGPALLSLRTGAPIIPLACFEIAPWRYRAELRAPLVAPPEAAGTPRERVAMLTQALATEFEALIRKAPDQWHLLQPNWPSDLEAIERWKSLGMIS